MAKTRRRALYLGLISLVIVLTLGSNIPTVFAAPGVPILISEFQPNPPGTDPATVDFEISGTPGTAFDLWVINIENDGANGLVDQAANITGTFDASGIASVTIPDLENPSFTVILTDSFTGAVGSTDIDGNNDGTVDDITAFGTILDAIGSPDSAADATTMYGIQLGGLDFAYVGSEPELVFRDASIGDWYAVDFSGIVYNLSGSMISASDFNSDPTATTFSAVNPSILAPILISEFQPNPPGTDPATVDFEISGEPSTAFDLWVINIENDGVNGLVDQAANITGTFDASGIASVTIPDLENPSFTIILTDSFTGSAGSTDIDGNNDGTVDDLTAFGTILDAIGSPDSAADATTMYGIQLGGLDFAYVGSEPELVFRDASIGDWYAVDYNDLVYNLSGSTVSASDFNSDPTATTFGAVNPSYAPSSNISLSASAACNGTNLEVTITTGDGPFDITGTGSGLPQSGVSAGTTALTGPDSWTGVTVAETAGDTESINLGDFTCPSIATGIIINEVDSDTPTTPVNDSAEFFELYDGGTGNTSLTGLVMVLFNGSGDVSYLAIDLDGQSTDANGYFVIGSSGVTGASIVLPNNTIQNGQDAVALYVGDDTDFPNSTAVTTTNLLDALVYDTSDADDAGLLVLLNAAEPQVNENQNGNGATESNQRCPNGTGGQRNTSSYEQWEPTPGTANLCMTVATNIVINELDSDNIGTDAAEFIELYDGGSGSTALDGLVAVFFNGSSDTSYAAYDLDGYTTSANGYFIIGNTGVPGVDITIPDNFLQNGADAVAIYVGNGADFPNGTAVTTTNLLDALVYDTADADDPGLLALLNGGEPQVDENGGGDGTGHSNQRCPNGLGGQRNTSAYTQMPPSPDADNPCSAIDLELSKVANQSLVFEGDTISFTITVSNTSTNQDATNVVVRDYFPDPTTQVDNVTVVNCPQGTTSFPTANTLEWAVGTIAQGVSYTCDVQMDIRTGTDGLTLNNYAEVYSATETTDPDSTPGNFTGTNFEDDADLASITVGSPAACSTPATLISTIQGSGALSPEDGNLHTIQGVITGDFQTSTNLRGFFIQEEVGDQDGDPATSEGIFVFDGNAPAVDVNIGDLVRVSGTVDEYFELTELTSISSVIVCNTGLAVTPTTINMPVTTLDTWEQHEGMLITIPQTLYATENYFQGQYGEVLLSTGGRLYNPTNVVEPGALAIAMQAANNLNVIQLEDGRTAQNPDPTPYLGANNTLRAGDTLPGLTGLLNYAFDAYEVHPVGPINFTRVNDRPGAPSLDPGTLKVASFNTLNYFTTLDNSGAICGPAANMDCRGADTAAEFTRQRDKIIAALVNMDADVIGLMEIENHAADNAVLDLVNGLNAAAGAGTYAAINTGPIGTDAIKVALIYKTATVSPLGSHAILDSTVDPTFLDTKNRPSLIQTFEEVSTGEVFTVSVNHLKSKGSACTDVGDPDTGDGQGNCNITRMNAATALINYLATDPTKSKDEDFLIIGDLNSYAKEDPIDAIKAGGYYDLIDHFIGAGSYSYVFDGQAGYLDHALATMPLKLQVKDVEEWHINADEPAALDYNDWNPAANYTADQYRASDHDPVLVSLVLGEFPTVKKTDPKDGDTVKKDIISATITFSKDVLADGTLQAANNVANYLLLESQGDGFQTASCAAAASTGIDPADTQIVINTVTYDAGKRTATINFNNGTPLPPGEYKLIICGTTSIEDLDGRKLNGGASDTKIVFTTIDPADYPFTATTIPETGITLEEGIAQATIIFSKAVLGDYSAQAANNIVNYLLLESQGDGFQTASCAAAAASGIDPADTQIVINSAVYNPATYTVTIHFNNGELLPPGEYRLYICGTTSIEDLDGRELNGGNSDSLVSFIVASTTNLPGTGFPVGMVTSLPAQPEDKAYSASDMMLVIPKLGLQMPVVGVPLSADGWDTTWLGDSAGYLEGSAFPTWNGNTVLTGHVWSAQNQPGPFARIKQLSYGDLIQIQAWGLTYTYQVQETELLSPFQVNKAMRHETLDWITLLTCEGYQPEWNSYTFRRIVRAVLIDVQ